MKKYTYVLGVITVLLLIVSIFTRDVYAQSVCGIIYEENGGEEEVEDCDNQFEASSAFPFTLIVGGVIITESSSYAIPLETTQTILLQATNADDVDVVALYRHEGEDFYGIEVDEVSPETQYETFFGQAGTYTLVLNRETQLVSYNEPSLWQKLGTWFLPTAHALEYPFSEIFTRTFTITEPVVEAECGFIVFDSYQEPVEDCDNPLGVVAPNNDLIVTFNDVVLEEGQAYQFGGVSDSFSLSGTDPQANALRSILYHHEGEDYVVEQDGLEEYAFTATGTYSVVVTEQDLILSDASIMQKIRSVFIPTAHAALGDLTIITFEVVEEEEEFEIDPLILQYAPILYMHEDEDYFPMDVNSFVDASALWEIGEETDIQLLNAEDLDFSTFESIANSADTENYYLAFSSSDTQRSFNLAEAKNKYEQSGGKDDVTVYYHKMTDTTDYGKEFIVLQYWFFYAMNNWAEQGGRNNHEGDWESVFIFLNSDTEEPEFVAYSSHLNDGNPDIFEKQYASVRRSWNSVDVESLDNHINNYVALGSHANYPVSGLNGEYDVFGVKDLTSSSGSHIKSENFLVNLYPSSQWLGYEGLWGARKDSLLGGNSGPQGPLFIDVTGQTRFSEPVGWAGLNNYLKVIVNTVTNVIESTQQKAKFVFDETLATGTEVVVDLHEELIVFGSNVVDLNPLPYFWDITSNLENGTFNTIVTFSYDENEVSALEESEENLVAIYYNPETDTWEPLESAVNTDTDTVSFETSHFSRYALGFIEQEEQTLEELYEQLRTTISDTELRRLYKKLLIRQVTFSEHFAEKAHPFSTKVAKELLKKVQRKINRYERKGLLTEDEKSRIESEVEELLEKLDT